MSRDNPVTPETRQPIPVYRFLDARAFLRHAYENEKAANRAFSHRYIARAMGAGSSSFFKDILENRVPLTAERAARFAKLFRLPPQEADHFVNLALYAQAETNEERARLLKKISAGIPPGGQTVLKASQLEYLSKWHYAALRELLAFVDFRGDDFAGLGNLFEPPLTEAETHDALQLLLRLRLVRRNARGIYEKV